jgi:hypothetical protein
MDRMQVVTVRMPKEEHEALRIFAFHSGMSINEVMLRAMRNFLATEGRTEEFDALLRKARSQYRVALDKLKDL